MKCDNFKKYAAEYLCWLTGICSGVAMYQGCEVDAATANQHAISVAMGIIIGLAATGASFCIKSLLFKENDTRQLEPQPLVEASSVNQVVVI